jgi:hypothetical protein
MKAIIYAGIGLFSAATVYGVVDYYGAKKQGVLKNLYAEEAEEPLPPVAAANNPATTAVLKTKDVDAPLAAVEKKVVTVKEKKAKKLKRTITFKSFSRGAIMEEVPVTAADKIPELNPKPGITAEPVAAPAVVTAETAVEVEKPVAKELPAKRPEVNMSMFSRGSLKKRVKKSAEPEKIKQQ